jgi:hypothetical protein
MNNRQSSFGDEDRSGGFGMNHGNGSHHGTASLDNSNQQRLQSPYNNNNMGGQNLSSFGSPYEQGNVNSPQAKQSNVATNPQQQPQQQVLYMAVPTADGRGQVLQPVQMVQLPGKPFAYVVPGQGGMPAMQGGMVDSQQQMMVLPSMQPHQQGQSNDLVSGLIAGNTRNTNQNKGMGYPNSTDNGGLYGDSSAPGLRGDDFNNPMAQGGIGGNNQFISSMNQPDASIAALYSTPQRPPLDALLGQVRRLSRDQVGCRLVQQALDEEGPTAASAILNEGLPFWGEAMVDPF